ncbi:MAG: reverse transcriptase domain-containing protein [Acidimicrobiaceae bacterium]|nr:reverse transcriptase domain-containing protein [Acidimicrobiaceae bacterium]
MSGALLDAFLSEIRAALEGTQAADDPSAGAAFTDAVAYGRALLEEPIAETLTAAAAELASSVRILQRRGLPVDELESLGDELQEALLATVTSETRSEAREFAHSVGERMLAELEQRAATPTRLAEQLGVDISQISRAARALRDDGLIEVDQATGDRRRRIYRMVRDGSVARHRWSWRTFAERLPTLRADDVHSDLLPGRVGDRLPAEGMASVCAAFRDDFFSGRYMPTPAHEVEIPKSSGGFRPAAALRFADRLVYAALVERCRPEIEASLVSEGEVLWPRGLRRGKQWIALEGFVDQSGASHVLSVDIQSFYDSIGHDVLAEALARARCDETVVSALSEWLSTVMGDRRRGLPQGLIASDPLATAVLAPLDMALRAAGFRYVRHGDDLRVLGSLADVTDAAKLIRKELRSLELTINDDKTRVLRHATYMDRRNEVSNAVREYLDASDHVERHSAIFQVLDALGADDELSWSWYHETLSVSDVLESVGTPWNPSDTTALVILLKEVGAKEEASARFEQRWRSLHAQPGPVLMRAGISLLAVAGAAEPAAELEAAVVARPEYTDALSSYIETAAVSNPTAVAGLLQRIEDSGVTSGAQWLRFYEALGETGKSGEFDSLAQTHVYSIDGGWMRRLRAARFMAQHGKLGADCVPGLSAGAPTALRDDVLDLTRHVAPFSFDDVAKREGATTAALLAATA